MNDLTRREFLNAVAGAAGSKLAGHTPLLQAAATAPVAAARPAPLAVSATVPDAPLQSLIFPQPRELSASDSHFQVDEQTRIAVPSAASEQDLLLARFLAHELGDRFDCHPWIERADRLDNGARVIVLGSLENSLVQQGCARMGVDRKDMPGPEGYVLRAGSNLLLVAGSDDRGAFWGLQSLRQLLFQQDERVFVRGVDIRDWPDKPFRGIYLYLPGRENIQYFRRFVRDFMAYYKYNTLIMEMGASMRLDRHPELNSGWVEFARDCNYSCRNYPPGPFHGMEQNSSHQDTADGGFLEKEEVADLARWVARHHIELIPEIASFTHSYYLLTKHRDLAAVPEDKWPDIYCPSLKGSYSLAFEVCDEYLEVLHPKMVHIGHDELFLPVNVSPQCHDQDIGELYGQDVKKIHDYLASRGVETALWGDMLLESVRGRGLTKRKAPDGFAYFTPGGMTPEQVGRLIPKDSLIFNWFWEEHPGAQGGDAKLNEDTLDKMGFRQVYGNFEPTITNYQTRKQRSTLLGGAPSAWFATNETGFGKELMATFLGCSNILWNGAVPAPQDVAARTQSLMRAIRGRLSGITPPSVTENSIVPLDISSRFNCGSYLPDLGMDLSGMATGKVRSLKVPFDLKTAGDLQSILAAIHGKQPSGLPKTVSGIPVGLAPTSLIFLHASAKRANNRESFRLIWDQQDTADLLGWYDVVYEDGYVTTIPIRYGVNILEWSWQRYTDSAKASAINYCYGADAVAVGGKANPITFFAYEWINPRLGKVIRELRLNGTSEFRGASDEFNNDWGPVIDNNAVILRAVSAVQKRS